MNSLPPFAYTADESAPRLSQRSDADHALIEHLNGACLDLDGDALQRALRAQGEAWRELLDERCPHLFAGAPVFVTAAQLQQMYAVVAAVERVAALPGWCEGGDAVAAAQAHTPGVFYGYDFHLNEQGAHLIEINSNAGGGFLNALLIDSQREAGLRGAEVAQAGLERQFLAMFRNEWRLARGAAPLQAVAIVDEQPESQYLYPEFLLAQRMFERAGIVASIADPSAFRMRGDGLYLGAQKIDLVYNRLTDFSLQRHPVLRQASIGDAALVTPGPAHYERYADKRNLVRLSDADALRGLGADEADVVVLLAGVPETIAVTAELGASLWAQRKQWFFKPDAGFGSKGAYRGEKLTRRVFGEILQGGYVAQRTAAPGERKICLPGMEPQSFKYDVRCYVYDGRVQLVAARLYRGQTTNFRTPGGGFAVVRVVG